MRQPRTLLLGFALLGASTVAACGGGSSHRIASAAGAASGATTSTTIDGDQAFLDYAHCMRAHDQLTPERLQGLTNYARCMREHQIPMLDPDPSDGHLSLGNVPGIANTVGRQDPEFQSADAACRSQLPAGVADDGSGPP